LELHLDPPRGVAPVRIGMNYGQALAAVAEWGEPRISGPYAHSTTVKVSVTLGTLDIVVLLEGGEQVTAIELWRFEDDSEDARVLFDGHDIFRTPARDVLREQESKGRNVDTSDPENPVIRDLTLAFTRETGQEVPIDAEDKLPLHFTSVLVADGRYS
jgi:hypothetical protein